MNLKRLVLVFGGFVLVSIVVLFWGCQQNQPTAPQEEISSRMRAETCEQYGTISVSGGEYIIQNNVWGASTRQCVESTGGTGFRVSVSEHNQGSVAGYPSIFKGCHWDICTANKGGGPIRVSDCRSAPFSFSVSSNRPSGDYNVAAEAWLNPSTDCSGGYSGGAEIMIVLDYHGMSPAGSKVGTFNGHDVYYTNVGWEFVTYVKTGRNSASGDMMDFINDAASRGYVNRSWYIHDMEAGFEIMSGGQGLECISFSFSMSGGGGSTTTSTTTTSGSTSTTTTSGGSTTTSGGGSNSIVVRARGTAGSENIRLTVNGSQIGSWTLSASYNNYSASTNNTGGVNVEFTNDASGRDVQVDYITVNGSTRQAENQSTNTGVWQNSKCGGSNSEWLHCNGYIGFGNVSGGGTSTTTTTTASTSTTTTTSATTSTTTTAGTTTTTSGGGETCSPVDASISAPFTQNGAGEYCWTATSCNYLNSWNLSSLTINGVNFTNKYALGSNLPAKIDGKWYIHYEGNYAWSHFELR